MSVEKEKVLRNLLARCDQRLWEMETDRKADMEQLQQYVEEVESAMSRLGREVGIVVQRMKSDCERNSVLMKVLKAEVVQ